MLEFSLTTLLAPSLYHHMKSHIIKHCGFLSDVKKDVHPKPNDLPSKQDEVRTYYHQARGHKDQGMAHFTCG